MATISKSDKAQQNELLEKYMSVYKEFVDNDDKFISWIREQIARIVELENGALLAIGKPRIKTDFCFGYGCNGVSTQEDYDDAHDRMKHADTDSNYFVAENLKQLTEIVSTIHKYIYSEKPGYFGTIPLTPYICTCYRHTDKIKSLTFMHDWDFEDMNPNDKANCRKATANELQVILDAYAIEIKAFEKRLQTYLKRYGLTKLHTWTYLSD